MTDQRLDAVNSSSIHGITGHSLSSRGQRMIAEPVEGAEGQVAAHTRAERDEWLTLTTKKHSL